ncbi:Uncharacterized protein TCM_031546 [Theobroma cacao]|uniref:Uncharacterized protein n=1 Tax=Theobroma cacao TaxID=3641 RepID=A0A061F8J6_THECC|nr:Uncharacterized protein TCM_031546 [Theobroma cacao]
MMCNNNWYKEDEEQILSLFDGGMEKSSEKFNSYEEIEQEFRFGKDDLIGSIMLLMGHKIDQGLFNKVCPEDLQRQTPSFREATQTPISLLEHSPDSIFKSVNAGNLQEVLHGLYSLLH